jgi:hypothetical protein
MVWELQNTLVYLVAEPVATMAKAGGSTDKRAYEGEDFF